MGRCENETLAVDGVLGVASGGFFVVFSLGRVDLAVSFT